MSAFSCNLPHCQAMHALVLRTLLWLHQMQGACTSKWLCSMAVQGCCAGPAPHMASRCTCCACEPLTYQALLSQAVVPPAQAQGQALSVCSFAACKQSQLAATYSPQTMPLTPLQEACAALPS